MWAGDARGGGGADAGVSARSLEGFIPWLALSHRVEQGGEQKARASITRSYTWQASRRRAGMVGPLPVIELLIRGSILDRLCDFLGLFWRSPSRRFRLPSGLWRLPTKIGPRRRMLHPPAHLEARPNSSPPTPSRRSPPRSSHRRRSRTVHRRRSAAASRALCPRTTRSCRCSPSPSRNGPSPDRSS